MGGGAEVSEKWEAGVKSDVAAETGSRKSLGVERTLWAELRGSGAQMWGREHCAWGLWHSEELLIKPLT